MAFWNKDSKEGGPTEEQVLGVLKRVQDPDLRNPTVVALFERICEFVFGMTLWRNAMLYVRQINSVTISDR